MKDGYVGEVCSCFSGAKKRWEKNRKVNVRDMEKVAYVSQGNC